MLTEHHVFTPTVKGGKPVAFEVNWNEKDAASNNSQVIKVSIDDKQAYISRDDLLQFVFAIGKADDQIKLIPQTLTKVHAKKTVFTIKATKDIRKGEDVVFAAEVDFECPYAENVIAKL